MKKIPITIDTMPLIRYRDLLLDNENYIPVTYKGSGLEEKDISIIDGKQPLNIYAEVESMIDKADEWYNGSGDNDICTENRNMSMIELPNILHFSITPFCDKFTLQLRIKQLDREKIFWSIGSKEYSALFGIRRFDYSVLRKQCITEKVDVYIKNNIIEAEKKGYRAVIWNIPGGIDKRIEWADSSNFVSSIAGKNIALCIISIPYTYDIEEIHGYINHVKREFKLKVNYVCMSNLIVDWSKSCWKENRIFYYTIKKDNAWKKKLNLLKRESVGINLIDVDDSGDMEILFNVLNTIAMQTQ